MAVTDSDELSSSPLTLHTEPDFVVVCGEIDASNADTFQAALLKAATPDAPLEVDMADVSFIDSSGIRALHAAQRSGCDLVVVNPSRQVMLLLDLTSLSDYFVIARTSDAAIG